MHLMPYKEMFFEGFKAFYSNFRFGCHLCLNKIYSVKGILHQLLSKRNIAFMQSNKLAFSLTTLPWAQPRVMAVFTTTPQECRDNR